MLDYPALAALAAVLRTGSFDGASAALGVTPSAVSQRIKSLEDRIGTALVIRGHPARPTEAGARLIRHADAVRLLERALEGDLGIGDEADWPTARIAVNADSLATWVLPALAQIGWLLFDIEIDDQDHSDDWLRRGAVSAAITARAAPVAGCDSFALGSLRYWPVAAPDFAARWFPDGPTAEALTRAPTLTFDPKDRLQHGWAARAAGRPMSLPCHRLGSSQGFRDACLLGLGWGMNPEALISADLAAGRLVPLDPVPFDTPLYWQVSRLQAEALDEVTSAVRKAAKGALVREPGGGKRGATAT